MKIVITEEQIKLIKESTNKSAKLLGKFYDIEADGAYYLGDGMIQSRVRFTPKDFDNPMTPQYGESVCNWRIDKPFSSIPGENITFAAMNLPDSFNVPLMDHIGNTEELEEYLKGLHMEEVEEFIKRIIHRRNNPLNENKNVNKLKRFFSTLLGEDFYDSIIPIDSYDDIPSSFDMPKGLYDMMMDHDGSIYYFVINGLPYVYMDMGKHEWFFDKHGRTLKLRHIESMLEFKISDLAYRFRDVIDLSNEGEPLNENVNGNEKIKNLLKKTLENQEFEISFDVELPDFDISFEWDELSIETWVGDYTIKFYIKVGDVSGEGSNAVASVAVIIVGIEKDGKDFYYDWVNNDYSEYAWYINDFDFKLRDDILSDFPFKVHPTYYGHDEIKKP